MRERRTYSVYWDEYREIEGVCRAVYGEGLITGNFIKFLWEIIKILLEYRRRNFHMDVEIKFYPIER